MEKSRRAEVSRVVIGVAGMFAALICFSQLMLNIMSFIPLLVKSKQNDYSSYLQSSSYTPGVRDYLVIIFTLIAAALIFASVIMLTVYCLRVHEKSKPTIFIVALLLFGVSLAFTMISNSILLVQTNDLLAASNSSGSSALDGYTKYIEYVYPVIRLAGSAVCAVLVLIAAAVFVMKRFKLTAWLLGAAAIIAIAAPLALISYYYIAIYGSTLSGSTYLSSISIMSSTINSSILSPLAMILPAVPFVLFFLYVVLCARHYGDGEQPEPCLIGEPAPEPEDANPVEINNPIGQEW